jgi:hypothetical protein
MRCRVWTETTNAYIQCCHILVNIYVNTFLFLFVLRIKLNYITTIMKYTYIWLNVTLLDIVYPTFTLRTSAYF